MPTVMAVRPRIQPRMSAPKLGDYLSATNANQREAILREQKFPAAFRTTIYQPAFDEIRRALTSEEGDINSRVGAGLDRIAGRRADTNFKVMSNAVSSEAIEQFGRIHSLLPLGGAEPTAASARNFQRTIERVTISVMPLVLLRRATRARNEIGALLVVLRKDKVVSEKAGEAVAELLRLCLVDARFGSDITVCRELCIVSDVFHTGIFVPPKASKRLADEIESACREIAGRWASIKLRAA